VLTIVCRRDSRRTVDSVRVNEVFGDTINWDLLPESMISSINLIGGANALFGLNTLGGALSVQTKNGLTNPGIHNQTYGGSFGLPDITENRLLMVDLEGTHWFTDKIQLSANVFLRDNDTD
jgi:hypothetical protein